MYEIFIAGVILLSQLQNLASIYAVEIQLCKYKINYYVSLVVHRVRQFFKYFDPPKETPKQPVRIMYEDKYKEKFQLQSTLTISAEKLKGLNNNVLVETTPIGNVLMFYNAEKTCFEYYSDKTIPFRFLETVARKYAIVFRCACIYVTKTKERANTFLYLGKLANYSFIKKVDKHITNKRLNVSFREFKNMKR